MRVCRKIHVGVGAAAAVAAALRRVSVGSNQNPVMQMLRHCFQMKLFIRQRVGLFHKRLITLGAFVIEMGIFFTNKREIANLFDSVMEDSKT